MSASKDKWRIICLNNRDKKDILDTADKLGLEIKEPMTTEEYKKYVYNNTKKRPFVINEYKNTPKKNNDVITIYCRD